MLIGDILRERSTKEAVIIKLTESQITLQWKYLIPTTHARTDIEKLLEEKELSLLSGKSRLAHYLRINNDHLRAKPEERCLTKREYTALYD